MGVGIIIRKDDRVLLVRRHLVHGAGAWSTPGGHLGAGETPESCGAREAREEVGVTVENVAFRAVTNDVFESEGIHYVTIWMDGDYVSGEPAVRAAYELLEVRWFEWNALPEPLFLPFQALVEERCYPPGNGGLASLRAVIGGDLGKT